VANIPYQLPEQEQRELPDEHLKSTRIMQQVAVCMAAASFIGGS
jgi:hypothetical protein